MTHLYKSFILPTIILASCSPCGYKLIEDGETDNLRDTLVKLAEPGTEISQLKVRLLEKGSNIALLQIAILSELGENFDIKDIIIYEGKKEQLRLELQTKVKRTNLSYEVTINILNTDYPTKIKKPFKKIKIAMNNSGIYCKKIGTHNGEAIYVQLLLDGVE